MEKRTPHTPLDSVKELVVNGKIRYTRTATVSANELGMTFDDITDVALNLTPADFDKSMTSYNDHKVWQEVYKPNTKFGPLYFKFTVVDQVLIVSCKEL